MLCRLSSSANHSIFGMRVDPDRYEYRVRSVTPRYAAASRLSMLSAHSTSRSRSESGSSSVLFMDEPQGCFFGVKVTDLAADRDRLVTAVAPVV